MLAEFRFLLVINELTVGNVATLVTFLLLFSHWGLLQANTNDSVCILVE